ncbi:carbon-nitrogen hydrolase family protein [Sphingomicrobium nitratireducens]|uniref:carbon-nitrogen hydrolase family protein n=1 Tax=Sphingomicrobium nitratireducens TaxID=2964666 RepID=UPI00223F8E8C|nr:carbon-nitrogen hydrolase family protein [Sphingomicrobium nitratireducens]
MTRIALFQATTGIDPQRNAEALERAIEEASAGGAAMLFTPEMSGLLDGNSQRAARSVRSEADDPLLARVREAAARRGLWVHLGSLALEGENGKFVNRALVIDATGEIRGRYDKMHLFDVDLPTGESWRESATYQRGEAPTLVKGTPVGSLGLAICYDLRFPALFARLAEAGADVIAIPAAFTVPTGKAHWEVMQRARAIEAELFVIAAAQVGKHEDGRETYGHSLVIDPWGEILLDMEDRPGVAFADINLARIDEVRSRIPVLQHRRAIAPLGD